MKTTKNGGWARGVAVFSAIVIGAMVEPATAQSVAAATHSEASISPSWTKRTFGRMEWAEAAAQSYGSPREIARLVQKNVRYKTEKVDSWATAEETWVAGVGDCEDFAILIQELCKLNGMDAKVHLYFPQGAGKEGHAVLVGEWNGKLWFSSNGAYEEVKSEEDVRRRVAGMLSTKASNLWVMKLSDRDVAKFIERAPSRAVASR